MRNNFITQLTIEAKTNKKIFLIVGDLGYSVVEEFRDKFPDRFLNIGIAEQNMIGVASGLASEGFCVFVYSIGNFPTLRCLEQIRYNVCYHNNNVNIVSVGAGYSYAALGASHHATEDIGILRTLPNLKILSPSDPNESRLLTKFAINYNGPTYLRLGKSGEQNISSSSSDNFQAGQINQIIKSDSKIAVFSTGAISSYAYNFLKDNNINSSLYTFPFLTEINEDSICKLFLKYDKIITIEEHQLSSGFGSIILEMKNLLENKYPKLKKLSILRKGISNKFLSFAGSQNYFREKAGLTFNLNEF
jgi:transketolase